MFELIPDINWNALGPAVVLALTGIIVLVAEMLRPKKTNDLLVLLTILGVGVSGFLFYRQTIQPAVSTLTNGYLQDSYGAFSGLLICISTILTVLFSESYLRAKKIPFGEFYALLTWSALGGVVMVSTKNMITQFVGLEVLSIALYVLASLSRGEEKSQESGLKYFLLGAFASAFLLYGMAMFYGATGSLQLEDVAKILANGDPMGRVLVVFGTCFMIVGLGFKCGFVPFHQWTPDVYQGAPTNVTSFMATVSKIAAFGALYRVLEATTLIKDIWIPILSVIAFLTMIVPNLIALTQKDVKRVMGYSSISNSGYLLVGLIALCSRPDKVDASVVSYFLFTYIFMTIGAFAVLSLCTSGDQDQTTFDDLVGLRNKSPLAAGCLVMILMSQIGIPPFGGFWAKVKIFLAALQADMLPLAIVLGITSVISAYYYLQIMYAAFVKEDANAKPLAVASGPRVSFVACAVFSLLALGLLNDSLGKMLGL